MENYRMVQHERNFTPYLIEEVYNFKDFVGKHLLDGIQKIVGIKSPQYFKFNMVDGTPVMQYKETIRDDN
jgi:hypothetical protein